MSSREVVPLDEARQGIASVSRRLALLHIAYAKAIIDEVGEERGMKIIAKAIKEYGRVIGEKTRNEVLSQGLDPVPENFDKGPTYRIPDFGMHDRIEVVEVEGEPRIRAYGCVLAKVWRELGENRLGRLYCYMDVAKYMAYNPKYKLVHVKCVPDGDEYCEFVVRPTTEEERRDFNSEGKEWFYIDRP
jgi:predicted hydrocarbon binding protein